MANNAVTRKILKLKPPPPPPPTQVQAQPLTDEEKAIQSGVDKIVKPFETKQRAGLETKFGGLEQKLFGQEVGRTQSEGDILARRFARIGGALGDEAEQKAFGQVERQGIKRLETGSEAIEAQKLAEQEALDSIIQGRRDVVGERLRGEAFTEAERLAGEEFTTSERKASEAAAKTLQAEEIAFDEEQAVLDRAVETELAEKQAALDEQQIVLDEKELDINTLITLADLAIQARGKVSEKTLRKLEDLGHNTDAFREWNNQLGGSRGFDRELQKRFFRG